MELRIIVEQIVDQVTEEEDKEIAGIYDAVFRQDKTFVGATIHHFARAAMTEFHESYAIAMLDDFNIYVVNNENMQIQEHPFSKFHGCMFDEYDLQSRCSIGRVSGDPASIKPIGTLKANITLDDAITAVKFDVSAIYEVPEELRTVDLCVIALLEGPDNAYPAIPKTQLSDIIDALMANEETDILVLQVLLRRMAFNNHVEATRHLLIKSPEMLQWASDVYLPQYAKDSREGIQMVRAVVREVELDKAKTPVAPSSSAKPRL